MPRSPSLVIAGVVTGICTGILAGVAAPVMLGGCGGTHGNTSAPAVAPSEAAEPLGTLPRQVFYIPGESMRFRLIALGVESGVAQLAVGEPGTVDGRRVLIVRSELESSGVAKLVKNVHDDIHTLVDIDSGALASIDSDLRVGDKHLEVTTRVKGNAVSVDYKRDDRPAIKTRFAMPANEIAYDTHSLLGVVRSWEPKPGDKTYFYMIMGRYMWLGNLTLVDYETIRTRMGVYPAIRLEGVASRLTTRLTIDSKRTPRSYTVWLSDDANRLPLRVVGHTEYGDIEVELTGYTRSDSRVTQR